MAYDGSLKFDTKVDNKGFKKGMQGLKSVASTSAKAVTTLMKGAAVAVSAIGIASIKVGSEFEAGMSNVAATMGITTEEIAKGSKEFELLEKAALEMGKTTQYSASDATEALNFLALAGYDAERAVDTLPKVLNLAAAGGLELGRSSEIVTNAINALGLEAKDAEKLVDQMAVTAQKSGTDVNQLGDAILTVGGTAKVMAGGTVELNTQLGILADAGIKGAEGGTALRNVLLSLSAPTDKQAKALKKLGVETYDANGNFRNTNDIFEDLNGVLGTMTEQERTQVLSELFNKVDLKAANALLAGSGDRFEELSEQIRKSEGAAEEMAATLNDNLKGKIELLKSAMEYLGIQIYKSVDSPLKDVVETITGYVDKISGTLTAHDDIIDSLAEVGLTAEDVGIDLNEIPNGFEAAVEVLGEIIADMLLNMAEAAPKFLEVASNLVLAFLEGIMNNRQSLIESLVEIGQSIITTFADIIPVLLETGIALLQGLAMGIVEALPDLIGVAQDTILTIVWTIADSLPILFETGLQIILMLIEGLFEMIPELMDTALYALLLFVESIMDNLPLIFDTAISIIDNLIDGLMEMLPELFKVAMAIIEVLIEGIVDNIDKMADTAIQIIDKLAEFIIDNLPTILDAALEIILAIIQGVANSVDKLVEAAIQIIDKVAEFIIQNLPIIIDAAIEIILAIMNAMLDNLDLIITATIQLVIAVVEAIIKMLPQLVNTAIQMVISLVNGLLNALPQLITTAMSLITQVIGAIVRMLPQLLALGVQLVGEIVIGLVKATSTIVNAGRNLIKSVFSAMKGALTGAVQIGTDLVKGIWNGINNVTGWILSKIKGFGSSVMKGIKGIFGIKSPSTLMRDEVGKNLALGIGVGFEAETDGLNKDMDKEMTGLAREMTATVNAESFEVGAKITANGSLGRLEKETVTSKDDNSDNSITITGNTFEIRKESDIEKVAQELDKLRARRSRA